MAPACNHVHPACSRAARPAQPVPAYPRVLSGGAGAEARGGHAPLPLPLPLPVPQTLPLPRRRRRRSAWRSCTTCTRGRRSSRAAWPRARCCSRPRAPRRTSAPTRTTWSRALAAHRRPPLPRRASPASPQTEAYAERWPCVPGRSIACSTACVHRARASCPPRRALQRAELGARAPRIEALGLPQSSTRWASGRCAVRRAAAARAARFGDGRGGRGPQDQGDAQRGRAAHDGRHRGRRKTFPALHARGVAVPPKYRDPAQLVGGLTPLPAADIDLDDDEYY